MNLRQELLEKELVVLYAKHDNLTEAIQYQIVNYKKEYGETDFIKQIESDNLKVVRKV